MALVTFNVDHYPYCKGDTVQLADDQRKSIDAEAEKRGIKETYTVSKDSSVKSKEAPSTEKPKQVSAKDGSK